MEVTYSSRLLAASRQFISFGIVGTIGFLVSSVMLLLVIRLFHFHPIPARLFSILPAVSVTWYLNRSLTFSVNTQKISFNEWFRYLSANGVGLSLHFTIYSLLILFAANPFNHPIIALAIGSISAMMFNFLASKHFVFR